MEQVDGFRLLGRDEVELLLDAHCIETTAKHVHSRLVGAYLEGRMEGSEIEGAIELLRAFLEGTDFRAVRASHPELAGSQRARVRLWRDRDGAAHWEQLPPD
ncbi:MAG: hypothetical protein JXR96_04510 [Deltaproteobacteria bacterium]|nr:hypothetical protein [Deltaproteobacteria bacterium]